MFLPSHPKEAKGREGGQEDLAYWLSKTDLLWLLQQAGIDDIDLHDESDVNWMPCIRLLARRTA